MATFEEYIASLSDDMRVKKDAGIIVLGKIATILNDGTVTAFRIALSEDKSTISVSIDVLADPD